MTASNGRATRREFLRRAGALSLFGSGAAPLALNLSALGEASAQTAGDYKALVCLFLHGGNDAYNTVLATDSDSWRAYNAVRNQMPQSLALLAPGIATSAAAAPGSPGRLGGVLPIAPRNSQGRNYALHPLLTAPRDLFAAGRLAVVSNVGPLLRPMTKADYKNAAFPRPASLFSHNDQQSTWQTLAPEGATAGWGGRMGDLFAGQNGHAAFTAISASGNAVWLSGRQVMQYQVSASGAIRIGGGSSEIFGSEPALAAMQRVMRRARNDSVLARDLAAVTARSIDAEAAFSAALPSASAAPFDSAGGSDPLHYTDPVSGRATANPLAHQLKIVARTIAGRSALNSRRQVFFVSLGGFDTHDNQNLQHAVLMSRLSHAIGYFDNLLLRLGVADKVTTFTASEFGRSFTSNGDGTDHGWGGHHFVMGGAVRGGDIYGNFPRYGAPSSGEFTSPQQIANGALLPQVGVDQFGATLGRWFGLNDSALADIFPSLQNFDPAVRDLGFMG